MAIITEAEYDQTIIEIMRLTRKVEVGLPREEESLLDLLSTLAEDWEEARHPILKAPRYRTLQLAAGFAVPGIGQ
jgi:antitoxin component HigA of HigAB toxin-antitoxin module